MLGKDAIMTDIQQKTLTPALEGKDILGRARTGTGKTLAFLVPALQNLKGNSNVEVLCVTPTIELATQISKQAEIMVQHHENKPEVQTMFGGKKPKRDIDLFFRKRPSVLVCTPGRLMAHLKEETLGVTPLNNLKVLVLDEADQLLNIGFRKEIMELVDQHILRNTTKRPQTMLFSATMPTGLRAVMKKAMRSNYTTVDCINDKAASGSAGATHSQDLVQQHHIITEKNDNIIHASLDVLRTIINHSNNEKDAVLPPPPPKIMVFLPTAHLTKFYASVWSRLNKEGLHPRHPSYTSYEMHSRKTQNYRKKVAEQFSSNSTGIMFSSDVSARGVDYPDVTHVVQIGAPTNPEQYIHRLGRTGRAGKKGQGILILTPFEKKFIEHLKRKNITSTEGLGKDVDVYTSNKQMTQHLNDMLMLDAKKSFQKDTGKNEFSGEKAYASFLGYLMGMSTPKGSTRSSDLELIKEANGFAICAGYTFGVMPEITAKRVGSMGLKKHRDALNVVKGRYKKQNPLPKGKKVN